MTSTPPPRALKGVALIMIAVIAFALADVTTKYLAMIYAVPLVVAIRYLVNLGLLIVILGPRQGRRLVQTTRTGLVMLRAISLALASLTMALALRYMPVGETVAIVYLAPFLVMMLAVPLLGERVPLAGWISAAVGFAGVLLIVRPGAGLDTTGVVLAIMNALCSTAYHLLSRVLAKTETTIAMLFHTALIGTLAFGAALPWVWDGTMPTLPHLGLMALLGALATLGHFLFTAAYREAPASLLAPVNYLHLVWAAIFGWLVFHHMPDALTLTGMALVTAAGIAIALRSHFGRQKAPQAGGKSA